MNRFDTLRGGTVARLRKMRAYRDKWNSDTRKGSKLADGFAACLQARSHGVGQWRSSAHGLHIKPGASHCSACVELVAGWRDVGASDELVSMRHTGWYADSYCDETYRGHVWQLPARDGEPQYVAGYTEHDGSGYVVLDCTRGQLSIFDNKEDAARAGDALAERMAEQEREYDERWQEASKANDERDDARADRRVAFQQCRRVLAALRELKGARPPAMCAVLAAQWRDARDAAADALVKIETARDRIAELNMQGEF